VIEHEERWIFASLVGGPSGSFACFLTMLILLNQEQPPPMRQAALMMIGSGIGAAILGGLLGYAYAVRIQRSDQGR